MTQQKKFPLVYSCSGCSSAAQMTNEIAIRLNREGIAEMSCIAGVGGGVKSLVKKAQSGRRILALDGCHLQCVKACLSQAGITADEHVVLSNLGVKKYYNRSFDPGEVENLYPDIRSIAKSLSDSTPG